MEGPGPCVRDPPGTGRCKGFQSGEPEILGLPFPRFPTVRLMKTRTRLFVSLFLIPAILLPLSLGAQLRIIPQGGLYVPVTDLGTVNTTEGAWDVGKRESSFAYGLTLESASAGAIAFRVSGIYGSDSEVPVGGVGCQGSACNLRSTVLGLSGGIALRVLPQGSPLRPYLLAGGGIKRYDFDVRSDSPVKDALGEEAKASAVLGLGFDWDIGILRGIVELTDYISGALVEDGDRQHGFFLTVGLVLG
jgi:hypothetical protein